MGCWKGNRRSGRYAIVVCAAAMLSWNVAAESASADPLSANAGVTYRLETGSSYQEGCFPPCLCPIWNEDGLKGTFRVSYGGHDGVVHHYRIEEINWLAYRSDGSLLRITGQGVYQVGSPNPITLVQQRMELDLKVNDDPVQHYDSGWVPVQDSTKIKIAVSINGMFCFDRAVHIDAAPVPASALIPYHLSHGSTFQRGCFDPCDCLLGPELPVVGSFDLVPLDVASFSDLHAVVNVRWRVLADAASTDVLPITGFGFYERAVGDAAHLQRLRLRLTVAAEPPASYDSGTIWGGELFPVIDAVVSQNNLVCYDTAIHVVTAPVGAGLCGGFAGIPCPNGQFCFYPVGTCGQGDIQGVCLPLGGANCFCPAVYDPVCGCDGNTYGNECLATCAGVSIAHPGECRQLCGGLSPLPPCDNDEFCKYPPGTCDDPSVQGHCTAFPQACPDVWMPVCGCDGVTYGNECEADVAGVSVDYPGPCASPCVATRRFVNPSGVYYPGAPLSVGIDLVPPAGVVAVALEDVPPAAWIVSNISHGGFYDAANGKVKWGPFFSPDIPAGVSYVVTPPNDTVGPHCFTGTVSVDGANQATCGDSCLGPACPFMAADLPRPDCPSCNAGDCTTCGNGTCRDHRISLCELIGYACAWLTGCHDDLAGMTRAAFVWRSGECYCWDDLERNWFPTACPAANSGCCGDANGLRPALGGSATNRVAAIGRGATDSGRGSKSRGVMGRSITLGVDVVAPQDAMSMALEIAVPSGWEVTGISDGGSWDTAHGKVKWGPYTDSLPRALNFTVEPTMTRLIPATGRGSYATQFPGTVSFDGINQRVVAD